MLLRNDPRNTRPVIMRETKKDGIFDPKEDPQIKDGNLAVAKLIIESIRRVPRTVIVRTDRDSVMVERR